MNRDGGEPWGSLKVGFIERAKKGWVGVTGKEQRQTGSGTAMPNSPIAKDSLY